MKTRLASILAFTMLAASGLGVADAFAQATALRQIGRSEVPGFEGDFDHFAYDLKGDRLFLAGEEMGTLEVLDLKTGKHVKTVKVLDEPHAIHFLPESNRLVVTDSGEGMTRVLDGRTYAVSGTIKLLPGADVMSYDASTKHVWIVAGGKNAATKRPDTTVYDVDPATGRILGQLTFDTDFTEGIAFEQKGHRAFINVAGKHYVAVVDKKAHKVIATWPIKVGQNNAPIGLDEANKRLFVVTRKPFKLVVLDTDTGATVASFDAPARTNELMFDKANKRIYLAGDDNIAVFRQKDADTYEELAKIASDKGAKTGILVPERNRLFVAVAGKAPVKASVITYEVVPAVAR